MEAKESSITQIPLSMQESKIILLFQCYSPKLPFCEAGPLLSDLKKTARADHFPQINQPIPDNPPLHKKELRDILKLSS